MFTLSIISFVDFLGAQFNLDSINFRCNYFIWACSVSLWRTIMHDLYDIQAVRRTYIQPSKQSAYSHLNNHFHISLGLFISLFFSANFPSAPIITVLPPPSTPFIFPLRSPSSLIDDNKWWKCAFHWQPWPSRYIHHMCKYNTNTDTKASTNSNTNTDTNTDTKWQSWPSRILIQDAFTFCF